MIEECFECGSELKQHDTYGKYFKDNYWSPAYIHKVGDIFKCSNEDCQELHYTDFQGELYIGYPC